MVSMGEPSWCLWISAEFGFCTPSAPPPTYAFKLTGHLKELAQRAPFTAFSLGIFTILSVFGERNYSYPESNNENKERT
jgi:hypothetical protein